MKVMMKLMARGPKAESLPSQSDTIMDRNMNRALTSRARPTFLDITFIFIAILPCSSVSAHSWTDCTASISFSRSSLRDLTLRLSSMFSSTTSAIWPLSAASWSLPSKVHIYFWAFCV